TDKIQTRGRGRPGRSQLLRTHQQGAMAMHVVSVCHQDGRSTQAEKLWLLERSSAREVSLLLGVLFKIASHERVVGLAPTTGSNDVVIPLGAACRYPNLIFREEERLGRVFRIVIKEADRQDELLFPISALTPPPPPGRSRLPSTWASSLPELRVRAVAAVIPELVSTGALTPQQGAAAVEMIRTEDPVIRGEGGSGGRGREWSVEAKGSFASMLKIVLRDRERGTMVGEGRGASGDLGLGLTAGDGFARREGREREMKEGEGKSGDPPEAPGSFQTDALALADVALVTGKITKKAYVRALHKAVTLDPSLFQAYHTDLQGGRDQPQSRSVPVAVEGAGSPAGAGGGVAQGEVADSDGEDLLAREATLRDEFLRQALRLVEEGGDGLSARHRAIVSHAIDVGHPWVAAIYDECMETGDVRGLMQNLQCLPALLERDQAAAFAANTAQPPPPGEADSPFWPRQEQQHQQHQQHHAPPQSESPPALLPQQQEQQEHQHQHQRQQEELQQPRQSQRLAATKQADPLPRSVAPNEEPRVAALPSVAMIDHTTPKTAPPSAPAAHAGSDPARSQVDLETAARGGPDRALACGASGSENPRAATPAFEMVVAQLCRVISGCTQLLRLRGVIGEREERALDVMSNRGSPVLLAAVEAYGANQDLEDLLDTLQAAAEVELSLTAEPVAAATTAQVERTAAPTPQRRAMPHQLRTPQQQQQQQQQQFEEQSSISIAIAADDDGSTG
ncbi:unnamed protein product, partial [Scytosiphon promiscuus]